ncbi:MAG: DUF4271 domain-containing protein [Bacteroidales bacterium]|nr:DUF4271 domain-containing protein [Bacteroidales bacterium]
MLQSAVLENRIPDALLNPYHFSLDSLNISCDSSKYISFLGSSALSNASESSALLTNNNSIFFYSIWILLFIIAIFGNIFHINLFNFFKIGFFEKEMQDHEKKQVSNNSQFHNILFGTSLFFLAIIIDTFAQHHWTSNHLFHFGSLLMIIVLLVLLKLALQLILGKIFAAQFAFKDFFKIMRNTYASSSFILFFFCLIILSSNHFSDTWIFIITLVLWAIIYLFRNVKFLIQQIAKKQVSIYFFMYFCTLEILSIPILIKSFYLVSNQIFVK